MILKSHSYSNVSCWRTGCILKKAWNNGAFFTHRRCSSANSYVFKENTDNSWSWSGGV